MFLVTRAIGVVDTVGLKLVVSGTIQSILSPSLALAVKKVDGTNFQETSFSLIETSSVQVTSPSLILNSLSLTAFITGTFDNDTFYNTLYTFHGRIHYTTQMK